MFDANKVEKLKKWKRPTLQYAGIQHLKSGEAQDQHSGDAKRLMGGQT